MQILTDACLALLASIGIWALGRMALDWLLSSEMEPEIMILLRAKGDGNGLKQAISKLPRSWCGAGVFLVDCGLTERGRTQSKNLAKREQGIYLCHPGDLENLVREANIWTKRGNATK